MPESQSGLTAIRLNDCSGTSLSPYLSNIYLKNMLNIIKI